jgi:transcriptional regulator with XRE-family HTH domain
MSEKERRAELAAFLRTKREKLSPAQAGLLEGKRRRTPGLRREEVSQLANISVEWYARLEQARDIHASREVLENIAQALLLNADERRHLFSLARQESPKRVQVSEEEVSQSLQRFLDALGPQPAYVMGKCWDVLARNEAANLLFGDLARPSARERNCIWSLFVDPARRRLFVDWEDVAKRALAEFRLDYGQYTDDPVMKELVDSLLHASPEFRRWWPCHLVQGNPDGVKVLDHPLCGRLVLEYHAFQVSEKPTQRLVVYTPQLQENTLHKLQQMMISV